jgi:hypothetical protein
MSDIKSQLVKDGDFWKVLPDSELEKNVLSFINTSWGNESGYFPGPQPISIERRHFQTLKRNEYFVCEKSDGVRHLLVSLMFRDKKLCLLVNRAFKIFLVTLNLPKVAYQGTILDGELVDKTFLVYDAVKVSGRDTSRENLVSRLTSADGVVNGILKMKTDPITIKIKTFFNLKNFSTFYKEYLPNVPYKVDGLIFTPVNEPIRTGTHETMFKWKPRDKNTIDFQAKKWGTDKWGLYVQEKGRLVFESELSLDQAPDWITEDCIVECQYMCDDEPRWWKPIGLRVDKKHSNNRKTFYRTLVNIRENIMMTEFVSQ